MVEIASATSRASFSWAHAVCCDLLWLSGGGVVSPPSGRSTTFVQWVEACSPCHGKLAKATSKYCLSPYANISTQWVTHKVAGLQIPLSCHLCGKKESTTQQLRLHLFRKHGMKDDVRLYIDTTHCTICMKEFHQRENVLNHVKKVNRCYHQLKLRTPLLSEAQAVALDAEERPHFVQLARQGRRRHYKDAPMYRVEGPVVPPRYGPVRPWWRPICAAAELAG